MKYTIETMDTGCIEILTFQDGRRYYKRTEKTEYGCRALDVNLSDQIKNGGFDSEIAEIVEELFNLSGAFAFLTIAEMAQQIRS